MTRSATLHRRTPRVTKDRSDDDRTLKDSGWWLLGSGFIIMAMVLSLIGPAAGRETGRGIIIIPLLCLAASPLLRWARNADVGFDLAGMIFAGLGLKFLAALARFQMVDGIYGLSLIHI